jgi:uncharacterized protein (UPF0332 family)
MVRTGKIKKQKAGKDQIVALIERSKKDIEVAKLNLKIDYYTSFTTAYNSMLKAGRALVLFQGYRTDDGSQHKTTVDFCSFFIDKKMSKLINSFDRMRRTRNTISYDPFYYDDFEKEDVEIAIENAEEFLKVIKTIVKI